MMMEERLKNLQKSMGKSAMSNLEFTEQHQKETRARIKNQTENEGEIFLAVMQLLVQEKTGYDLAKHLRGRGIRKFEDNEGFLYMYLHQFEQKCYIQSRWDDSETKYYQITNKGKKFKAKLEQNKPKEILILKELMEG